MTSRTAVLVSINVSDGGVPKQPVASAYVSAAGVGGDRQRNLDLHGGPGRAVTLYSMERIEALQVAGHAIAPGTTGENLTVRGLDWDLVIPGAVLHSGTVILEITGYANPCRKIRSSFADDDSSLISQAQHPGWSRVCAKVVGEGMVRVGDAVTLD